MASRSIPMGGGCSFLPRDHGWLGGWMLVLWCGWPGWGGFVGLRCEGAAGDMVLRVTVTGKGTASLPPVMSDQCEGTFSAELLYRPDPVTGRYGGPVKETYTMSASGSGNVMDIESWTYAERQPQAGSASLSFQPSEGKAIIGWSYVDDHIRSAGGRAGERSDGADVHQDGGGRSDREAGRRVGDVRA